MNYLSSMSDAELINEIISRKLTLRQHDGYLEEQVRHLSQKLREAEKVKSTFVSNVRNEINNPLTALLGLSDSLTGLTDDKNVCKISQLIYKEIFELDFQLRNIIASAELENGEINIQVSNVDVNSVIQSQVAYLNPRLKGSGVKIRAEEARNVHWNGDAAMLQLMVTNVLANAIEFSKENTIVSVSANLSDKTLTLSIRDHGVGIMPADLDGIFDRFRQAETGTTKTHKGQGLGLSVVSGIVNLLGGKVDIEAMPGVGTTVTINLPQLSVSEFDNDWSSFGNEVMFNDGTIL